MILTHPVSPAAIEVLEDARARGFDIYCNGNAIWLRQVDGRHDAEAQAIADELAERIDEHQADVIAACFMFAHAEKNGIH